MYESHVRLAKLMSENAFGRVDDNRKRKRERERERERKEREREFRKDYEEE